ncbi:hypothetical protein CERSUDRAFT_119284 [Gelatoporia subvermispora B]|uniref:Uncharacterized protein n=1 Tax=Ceriporiopsis subvermispora (strain B) TaxID=914234 RepID=M2Q587_CERS8|nr:hypothetical protein CERSUDRAFT_119284 [Gelatoporia subvermispora B]
MASKVKGSYTSPELRSPSTYPERTLHDANYPTRAFHEHPYRGNAPQALTEYLTRNNRLFAQPERGATYYGKFGYVIQGKGAGKSRTCIEMGHRGVFVIYMNMSDRTYDPEYPGGDMIPRRILLGGREYDEDDYGITCCAFFVAVFKVFGKELEKILQIAFNDRGDAVRIWHTRMYGQDRSHRDLFLSSIYQEYEELRGNIMTKARRSALLSTRRPDFKSDLHRSIRELRIACAWLFGTYGNIFDDTDFPRLAIVLDDAQWFKGDGLSLPYQPSEILCRIIAEYSQRPLIMPLWVLFVSRDPSVANFGCSLADPLKSRESKSNEEHARLPVQFDFERPRKQKGLFTPFTALGWDQFALPLGSVAARDVAKLEHMSRFGRPWWYAVTSSSQDLGGLMSTMARATWPKLQDPMILLFPRFCLRIDLGHVLSQQLLEKSINEQCRICIPCSHGPVWAGSTYPSEPFLANLAAHRLNHHERFIINALRNLSTELSQGVILTEPKRRLESRLLLLLCKDHLAQQLFSCETMLVTELTYCRMIPLSNFLEHLFGPDCWPVDEEKRMRAQAALRNAYINFSHWVQMDEVLGNSRAQDPMNSWNSHEWVRRLWARSAAIQCSRDQADVDQLLPVYFETTDSLEPGVPGSRNYDQGRLDMSYLLITSADGVDATSGPTIRSVSPEGRGLISDSEAPFVAISYELDGDVRGVQSDCCEDEQRQCLRISAAGMDQTIFKFMSSDLCNSFRDLLAIRKERVAASSALGALRSRFDVFGRAGEQRVSLHPHADLSARDRWSCDLRILS